MAADRAMDLRKLHALTGLVPLAGYLCFHLWETASATSGRQAFVGSVTGAGGGSAALWLETLLVLLPLGAHAGMGIAMAARDRRGTDPGSHPSRGLRNLQRATGVAALAFVLLHLGHTWWLKVGGGDGALIYDQLRSDAGRPVYLVAYVLGLTCVFFHLAQGVPAAARTLGFVRTDAGHRGLRVLGAVAGLVLWLAALNTLSHFAVGRALGGGGAPESVSAESDPAGEMAP